MKRVHGGKDGAAGSDKGVHSDRPDAEDDDDDALAHEKVTFGTNITAIQYECACPLQRPRLRSRRLHLRLRLVLRLCRLGPHRRHPAPFVYVLAWFGGVRPRLHLFVCPQGAPRWPNAWSSCLCACLGT